MRMSLLLVACGGGGRVLVDGEFRGEWLAMQSAGFVTLEAGKPVSLHLRHQPDCDGLLHGWLDQRDRGSDLVEESVRISNGRAVLTLNPRFTGPYDVLWMVEAGIHQSRDAHTMVVRAK